MPHFRHLPWLRAIRCHGNTVHHHPHRTFGHDDLGVAISEQSLLFNQVMHAIQRVRAEKTLAEEHPYHWITAFDDDDLTELELELLNSLGSVLHKKDVEAVESTVYEWKASARVIQTNLLADAMDDESNPVPLTPPPVGEGEE